MLGVVYLHTRTEDGGDLYCTRFAEPHQEHLDINNWYEENWFTQNRVRLLGTSSVYRVPTKPVNGTAWTWWSRTAAWGRMFRSTRIRSRNS